MNDTQVEERSWTLERSTEPHIHTAVLLLVTWFVEQARNSESKSDKVPTEQDISLQDDAE